MQKKHPQCEMSSLAVHSYGIRFDRELNGCNYVVKHNGNILQDDDSIPATTVKTPVVIISEVGKFCWVLHVTFTFTFILLVHCKK